MEYGFGSKPPSAPTPNPFLGFQVRRGRNVGYGVIVGPSDFHVSDENYRLVFTDIVGFRTVAFGSLVNYGKKAEYQ